MDRNNFVSQSLKDLQKYLKDRGVTFSDLRKPELIDLCREAERLCIEVDPDGLLEDREEILKEKLTTEEKVFLPNPETVQGSKELNLLPPISIFDIYNYLITFNQYDHASLRDYQKMESYGLFEDGYVLDVECCQLHENYCALKSHVKPRTNEKDPISKLTYYKAWIVFSKTAHASALGTVFSAYCTCKGGVDGGCRHVVATLFEVSDFLNDRKKESVTSGPCLWVKRSTKSSEPVLVTDLDTSLTSNPDISVKPSEDNYEVIPLTVPFPQPQAFIEIVREVRPSACMLDAFEGRSSVDIHPEIDVQLPLEKTTNFWTAHLLHLCSDICYTEFLQYMQYTTDDIVKIEKGTQGQRTNKNWEKARSGLLTSSNFKTICHSTNYSSTAKSILKGATFDNSNIPAPVSYGVRFENKARDMFIKSHRFRHRRCKVEVPGLIISSTNPVLATSPDGIVDCSGCGQFLVEVKCLYTYRNFHPSAALLASRVCERDENDQMKIIKQHKYNYQMQGQMGITGIQKSFLVGFTNKGIHPVIVDFEENMWDDVKMKLTEFYKSAYLPEILRMNNLSLQ